MEKERFIEELYNIKIEVLERAKNNSNTQITPQKVLVDVDIIYSILNKHIKALEQE